MPKELTQRYKNPELQKRWKDAVEWLRTYSKNGWILDGKVERKNVQHH